MYRRARKFPGWLRTNPVTGWPFDIAEAEHFDQNLAEGRGLPNAFGYGSLRANFCSQLLSNWMGDDGFIRRIKVDTLEPYIYGDALWLSGEVVKKYKEKVGEIEYGSVDVKIETVNQLKENISPGTATVYLPSKGKHVKLPVPF